MKILKDRFVSISVDKPRDLARSFIAGAIIDDDTGEMKTNSEIVQVFFHFRSFGQFVGFSESLGPFQIMRFGSLLASSRDGSGLIAVGPASRYLASFSPSEALECLSLILLILFALALTSGVVQREGVWLGHGWNYILTFVQLCIQASTNGEA